MSHGSTILTQILLLFCVKSALYFSENHNEPCIKAIHLIMLSDSSGETIHIILLQCCN